MAKVCSEGSLVHCCTFLMILCKIKNKMVIVSATAFCFEVIETPDVEVKMSIDEYGYKLDVLQVCDCH